LTICRICYIMMKECCAFLRLKSKRILTYALIFMLLFRSFLLFAECDEGCERVLLLSVVQNYDEHTGQTEILLIKENDAPFCGLLLSLESEKQMRVVSCQRGEAAGKATLSYDEGMPLFVMLDCSENISGRGVLARFLIETSGVDSVMMSVISAYAINESDLTAVSVNLAGLPLERSSDFSVYIEKNADETVLNFLGTVSAESFAACVDVWMVDVETLKAESLCFSGVADPLGRFALGEIALPRERWFCLIIEFSEYDRSGLEFKEERVFVLYDGVIY